MSETQAALAIVFGWPVLVAVCGVAVAFWNVLLCIADQDCCLTLLEKFFAALRGEGEK